VSAASKGQRSSSAPNGLACPEDETCRIFQGSSGSNEKAQLVAVQQSEANKAKATRSPRMMCEEAWSLQKFSRYREQVSNKEEPSYCLSKGKITAKNMPCTP